MTREGEAMAEDLVRTVKLMADACQLQNSEQICTDSGAIGAVRMIQSEYLTLRRDYVLLLAKVAAEREACAKIAETAAGPFPGVGLLRPCAEIAAAIRARGAEGKEK